MRHEKLIFTVSFIREHVKLIVCTQLCKYGKIMVLFLHNSINLRTMNIQRTIYILLNGRKDDHLLPIFGSLAL